MPLLEAPLTPLLSPGSSTGACTREEAIQAIAKGINQAHKATKFVVPLIENMVCTICTCSSDLTAQQAGKGNVIGGRFEDLAGIIAAVEDKSRVGVCLDTCHTFAAGYDLRTSAAYEATMQEFDSVVGFKYL